MTNDIKHNIKHNNALYQWHPMAHPAAMQKNRPDIIARGKGVYVWDIDGHEMIDGVAGLWSSNLGHSCQAVRDAVVAQLDELPFFNTFRGTTHPKAIELSTELVKLMQPEGVRAVMFSNGGSDAVEGALKIARQFWKLQGQGDRTKFISLRQGYHGVHFGGASVNGNTNFRRAYEPLLPGCFHIDTPWTYRNPYSQDPEELAQMCATLLEREIIFQGADTVAAFIAEPVQGAGGVIVPPASYWPLIRKVCDTYGVLLIADEVVTGFGRTGQMFGTRLWSVNADIWCLAKGITSGYIPMGATALGERVVDVFNKDTTGAAAVAHGYTYSAHPVAAAAAVATLKELQTRRTPEHVAVVGAAFQARLKKLESHPMVGEVRGVGLMLCIDMVADKITRAALPKSNDFPARVAKRCYELGLMVRISGNNLILSPPLILTMAEMEMLCARLEQAFGELHK